MQQLRPPSRRRLHHPLAGGSRKLRTPSLSPCFAACKWGSPTALRRGQKQRWTWRLLLALELLLTLARLLLLQLLSLLLLSALLFLLLLLLQHSR